MLLGVRPEGAAIVGDDLAGRVEYERHVRLIRSGDSDSAADLLEAEGLLELASEHWLEAPRSSTAEEVLAGYVDRLQAAGPAGDIEGLRIIDPSSSATYYRGRWRTLRVADNGRFVARRPQAYGAALWCFTEVTGGEVQALVDLPALSPLSPGADEAWRLQAAIDALANSPQRTRSRTGGDQSSAILDLFSPVPSWLQRRLDAVGTPVLRGRGALFSYALPAEEAEEELEFLHQMMWTCADEGE
jgi:hypothetical protein